MTSHLMRETGTSVALKIVSRHYFPNSEHFIFWIAKLMLTPNYIQKEMNQKLWKEGSLKGKAHIKA